MESITFITTTIRSKWLPYQQALIQKHFPSAGRVTLNGSQNWPYAWFNWLEVSRTIGSKWIVLCDEDFFFFDSRPLDELAEFLGRGGYDIAGVSDGYHHFRQQNPVAMNSFFLIMKTKSLQDILKPLTFRERHLGKRNIQKYFSIPLVKDFRPEWRNDAYPHNKFADCRISDKNFESYYPFFWTLKSAGFKFYYLFPFFDSRFRSTNPRIHETSEDIGVHMWYARNWKDRKLAVHGMVNFERYRIIEDRILEHLGEEG